jgi:hypothetical protein
MLLLQEGSVLKQRETMSIAFEKLSILTRQSLLDSKQLLQL